MIASHDGTSPKPPALFGRLHFDALLAVAGDRGARDLIRSGQHLATDPSELVDVDTPEALAQLRGSWLSYNR